MKLLARWWRFNLVGAMGTAVQLATFALFNHWSAGHYLLASSGAIELTLMHNFTWHLHFTWRDRRESSATLSRLLRFHLSNGLVSLTGNLIVMRLLVHSAHLPLLLANGAAIACCSVVNFGLSDRWTFHDCSSYAAPPSCGTPEQSPPCLRPVATAVMSFNPERRYDT